MTPSDTSNVLPETAAAERLRQHLQEIARRARQGSSRAAGTRGGTGADPAHRRASAASRSTSATASRTAARRNISSSTACRRMRPTRPTKTGSSASIPTIANERSSSFSMRLPGASEDYTADYRIVRPNDGQTRWIDVVAKIERDSERPRAAAGRRPYRRHRPDAGAGDPARKRGALSPDRQQRAGADLGHQARPHALLRQPGLCRFPRPAVRGSHRVRLAQGAASGRPAADPAGIRSPARPRSSRSCWKRATSAPTANGAGCARNRSRAGTRPASISASSASPTTSPPPSRPSIDLRQLNEILELRITERTAQLESNEAQMRAIFETSHQYQGLLNLHGDVLYANKTALAGIRAEASDVIGKPFWDTPWFSAHRRHARHRPRRLHRRDAGRRSPDRDAAAPADRRALFRLRDASAARPARRHHRRGAGGRRRHRAPPGRGSAAPVAEDGSGRPIDRRRGARLQQSPDHHPLRDRLPAPPRTAGRTPPPLHRRHFRDRGARLQADRHNCWRSPAGSR